MEKQKNDMDFTGAQREMYGYIECGKCGHLNDKRLDRCELCGIILVEEKR